MTEFNVDIRKLPHEDRTIILIAACDYANAPSEEFQDAVLGAYASIACTKYGVD